MDGVLVGHPPPAGMAENGHASVGSRSCCPGLDQGPGESDDPGVVGVRRMVQPSKPMALSDLLGCAPDSVS